MIALFGSLIGFLASAGFVGIVGAVFARCGRKWDHAFQEEVDTTAEDDREGVQDTEREEAPAKGREARGRREHDDLPLAVHLDSCR